MRSHSGALVAGLVCLGVAVVVVPMSSWLAAAAAAAGEGSIGVAGCNTSCGGVDIPFPFSMGPDYGVDILKPFNRQTIVELFSISLEQGEAKVLNNISSYCYDYASRTMEQNMSSSYDWRSGNYSFSRTANKFTVVGCRALAYFSDFTGMAADNFWTGCVSVCYDRKMSLNPCSGMGCCQTTIPKGHQFYTVWFDEKIYNGVLRFGRCSFAVLMDSSNFSSWTSSSNNNSLPEFNNITSTVEVFFF